LAPPAVIIDKMRYSAFAGSQLLEHLMQREADGVVVTGAETDVCVLSTILDTVDLGYRVVLVQDAVCSSSDEGHNALLKLYRGRFSEQIVNASAQDVLARWK
jgi:nicotinamidase-related amidase